MDCTNILSTEVIDSRLKIMEDWLVVHLDIFDIKPEDVNEDFDVLCKLKGLEITIQEQPKTEHHTEFLDPKTGEIKTMRYQPKCEVPITVLSFEVVEYPLWQRFKAWIKSLWIEKPWRIH